MFELNFRDERLLPFEGAGAVSTWRIDLPQATNRFDLRTLTDAVVHIQYTAREGGGALREAALAAALETQVPIGTRLVSLRNEMASAWHAFETELDEDDNQVLTFSVAGKLPYVPGTGAPRLTALWAALDVQSPQAAATSVEADIDLAPDAGPVQPIKLSDASLPPSSLEYDVASVEAQTFTITVKQATILAQAEEHRQEYPDDSGKFRLHPNVFKDLILILRIERDLPV